MTIKPLFSTVLAESQFAADLPCRLLGLTALRSDTNLVTLLAGMIKRFRHKGLAEFFATGVTRGVQAKHTKRLRLILTLLNAATHARQMGAPGLRLHPLKGKPEGRWAVDVDENFRVVFRFEEGHATEVDYGDYH